MERKDFIKTCGLACLTSAGFGMILQSCGSATYFASHTTVDNRIVIKKSEFLKQDNNNSKSRKHILIQSEKFLFPICVFKIHEDQYSALLMKCTHMGCELQPQADYLVCPCHGSEFNNLGAVQNPPAELSLQSFTTKTDHENIYVVL